MASYGNRRKCSELASTPASLRPTNRPSPCKSAPCEAPLPTSFTCKAIAQPRRAAYSRSQRELREKLLEAARRREIDVVLVWRLDRWGRSVADLLTTLQERDHLGVGFVSLTEALDLTTPSGRAMAALLAVFAEFEGGILRERVRAGLAHARLNGKKLGRPERWHDTPLRSGNCITPVSANPKSPGASRLAAPRCVAS